MINPPNNIPTVVNVLSKIGDIILKHLMLNRKSMDIMHSQGYNGFKRMHRYNSMKFLYFINSISCKSIDDFGIVAKIDGEDFNYIPVDLKSHFENWIAVMEEDLTKMALLSNQFFNETGVILKTSECFINCLYKNKEKIKRYNRRFTESNWLPHDIHVVDDFVHAKYKEKEEKYEY